MKCTCKYMTYGYQVSINKATPLFAGITADFESCRISVVLYL